MVGCRCDRRPAGAILLRLEYRPPLDWPALLGFLAIRATPGVEVVRDDAYHRTVAIDGAVGLIQVRPTEGDAPALEVRVSDSLGPVLIPLLAAVRRLFDLDAASPCHPNCATRRTTAGCWIDSR